MEAKYRWAELTWEEIGARAKDDNTVVVVPVGSIEQHGRHLPTVTDSKIVTRIAELAVKKASEKAPTLLVPTLVFGCSHHHMEFPGTLSLGEDTFIQIVYELGLSIIHHGFRKLFFLNGHGGNEAPLQVAVSKLRHDTNEKVVLACSMYFQFIQDIVRETRKSPLGGICHAGEFETAAILYLDGSLVNMAKAEECLPRWSNEYFTLDFLEKSKVKLGLHVRDFSSSGVLGDPSVATAESGKAFMETAIVEVARFIEEFSTWELKNFYGHK